MTARFTCLVLLLAPGLTAQNSGVIFGTITDPSGAALIRAAVTATNLATGDVSKVESNDAGDYIFPSVQPGNYKLTCQAPGFETLDQAGIALELDPPAPVDLRLKI